jgi:cytochrome c oxidase subunit 3
MLFAGFTSAYIVLMGDSFWLKYPMPDFFWFSTATVGISSVTFILAIRAAKQDKQLLLKSMMGITTILGALFIYFQFRGYGELIDKGFYAANNHIMVVDGKYGSYFKIVMYGKSVDVYCNDYLLDGKKMTNEEMQSLQEYTAQFLDYEQGRVMKMTNPNPSMVILMDKRPIVVKDGKVCTPNGTLFTHLDALRLKYFAENIRDNRGDFYAKGEIGKDFHIYYKGEELGYNKNRKLTYQGKELSAGLETKAIEAADSASSFLYIITFIHLLHIAVAMIYLIKITINSFSGRFNSENHLSLRTGAIFWHFLGLLWVYLLLFLIYIH